MSNVMKSELFRVKKSGIALGVEIFFLVTTLLWAVVYIFEWMALEEKETEIIVGTGFDSFAEFPSGTLYFLILAFFVGGLLAGDYTTGAIKQIASRGLERRKILLGQYVVVSAYFSVITLIAAVLRAIVVTLLFGIGEEFGFFALIRVNLGWFVVIWSYSALAVLIAHLVRSTMMSLVLHLCLLVGGNLAMGILMLVVNSDAFDEFISNFWLSQVQLNALKYDMPVLHQLGYMGLLVLMGVICLALGIFFFEKRDVA